MKQLAKKLITVSSVVAIALTATTAQAKRPKMPDTTTDGLVRIEKTKRADYAYALPGADLSGYNKFILLEPQIAFQKHWQSHINSGRTIDRITDEDMENMIIKGKKLFTESFTKVLNKKGFPVVHTADANTLLVRASIINLEIDAPDPDNTAGTWHKVYTEDAGEATLVIELYDSITGQILVRAIDHQEIGEQIGWAQPRTQFTNKNDARAVFNSWAKALAKGLEMAKDSKAK